MKRKLLALMLTAVMLLTAFPMVISAEDSNYDQYLPDPDTIITKGNLTDTITWEFVKSESTLYITGTGAMPDFSGVSKQPWGYELDGMGGYSGLIKKFVISEGITYVGRFAFGDCQNLTEIVWPGTLEGAGDYLFYGCNSLKTVTLPKVETITANMVYRSALQHIIVPEGVKKIEDGAFMSMVSLQSIELPQSLEEIGGGAFMACKNLKSIVIPEGVKKINDLTFSNCHALEEITIPETTDLNSWGAFYECEKLCDEDGYLIINGALLNFTADVTSEVFVVPDGVKFVGALFSTRDNWGYETDSVVQAKKIIFPDSVEGIADLAFFGNDNLEEVVLSNNIKEITDQTFYYCENLKKITLPKNLETIGANAFSNCKKLEEIVVPAGVKELCEGAFESCESLKHITITRSVETISADAFANCPSLESVTFKGSQADWAKVTVLENNDDLLGASFTFEEILAMLGDVNGDGEVGLKDALMMRKYLANILGDGDLYMENADLNGDGKFSAKDLLALRKMLAK